MTLYLEPEFGPPPPEPGEKTPPMDLAERAAAASKTMEVLVSHGLKVRPTKKDSEDAAAVVAAYAANPENTSKVVSHKRMSKMTPSALRHIDLMLKEFSHNVVESSTQLRHYVTNKLVEESANPDPRIRMKALELLGKISDVGLFAEKTEVTITHQTTDDLRESLRAKLSRLTNPSAIIDAEVVEAEPVVTATSLMSGWDDEDE